MKEVFIKDFKDTEAEQRSFLEATEFIATETLYSSQSPALSVLCINMWKTNSNAIVFNESSNVVSSNVNDITPSLQLYLLFE